MGPRVDRCLSQEDFVALKCTLSECNKAYRFVASRWRAIYSDQAAANNSPNHRHRAQRLGLNVDVKKALRCPQRAVSVLPLPVIDRTMSPTATNPPNVIVPTQARPNVNAEARGQQHQQHHVRGIAAHQPHLDQPRPPHFDPPRYHHQAQYQPMEVNKTSAAAVATAAVAPPQQPRQPVVADPRLRRLRFKRHWTDTSSASLASPAGSDNNRVPRIALAHKQPNVTFLTSLMKRPTFFGGSSSKRTESAAVGADATVAATMSADAAAPSVRGEHCYDSIRSNHVHAGAGAHMFCTDVTCESPSSDPHSSLSQLDTPSDVGSTFAAPNGQTKRHYIDDRLGSTVDITAKKYLRNRWSGSSVRTDGSCIGDAMIFT